MIIFGTRTSNSRAAAGFFNCPRCSSQRSYTHQVAKRWFTLYFIPVIPLGKAGEFIECDACGGSFGLEVLQFDPAAEQAEMFARVRRLAVLAMLFGGRYQAENVAALRAALQELSGEFVHEETVHQDVQFAQQAQAQLEHVFQAQTTDLSADGKTMVMQISMRTLAPTRQIAPTDHQVLHRAGASMGIPADMTEHMIQGYVGLSA